MISNQYLAKRIKSIYDFNEYSISKDNLIIIVDRMVTLIEKYKFQDGRIEEFFNKVDLGQLGIVHRQPSSLLSMFWKYQDSNRTKLSM